MSNQINIEGKINGYVIDYGYTSDYSGREEQVYLTWAEVIAQLQARPLPYMTVKKNEETPAPAVADTLTVA